MQECDQQELIYKLIFDVRLAIVRHKVKELILLVQDDERMRTERKRAKKNRDKYTGMSSDKLQDTNYSKG